MRQIMAFALCALAILTPVLTANGQETSDDTHLGRVLNAVNQRFDAVEKRFDAVEKRIDQRFEELNQRIDQRFDAVGKRLDSAEDRLNLVESKVDHVSGQLSMAMWILTALIALAGLFASIYFALRKRNGEKRVAGAKTKKPYENPQPEYIEGAL